MFYNKYCKYDLDSYNYQHCILPLTGFNQKNMCRKYLIKAGAQYFSGQMRCEGFKNNMYALKFNHLKIGQKLQKLKIKICKGKLLGLITIMDGILFIT